MAVAPLKPKKPMSKIERDSKNATGRTLNSKTKSKTPAYTSKQLREKKKKFMFTNSKGVTSRYGDI